MSLSFSNCDFRREPFLSLVFRLRSVRVGIFLIALTFAMQTFWSFPVKAQFPPKNCLDSDAWLRCTDALQYQKAPIDPEQDWQDDADYWLTPVSPDDPARQRLYVVGDRILLNTDNFPSFSRHYNDPRVDLQEIVFDAREIVIDMPLNVDSVLLTIRAETVTFTHRGRFVLESQPENDDGISIISKTLDLRGARGQFFQFPTTLANWPATGPSRTIAITSVNVVTELLQSPTDWTQYFESKTLDPDLGITNPGAFDLDVNTGSALNSYLNEFAQNMVWPTATATKLLRHFATAPYTKQNRDFIKQRTLDLQAQLPTDRFEYAKSLLGHVLRAIEHEQDLNERSAYFIPRQNYDYLIEYFDRANEQTFETLDLWAKVLGDLLAGNTTQPRTRLRASLQQQNSLLAGQTKDIQAQIADNEKNTNALQSQLDTSLKQKLDAEQDRLNRCLDAQANAAQKKAQLKAITQLVSFAGTAAAAAFCPPAAPFIAGGLSVGGSLINRDSGINSASDVIDIAKAAAAASKDYQDKAGAFNQAMKDVSTALNTGKYDGLGDKLSGASSKLKDVVDWMSQAINPPPIDKKSSAVLQGCGTGDLDAIKAEYVTTQNEIGKLEGELVQLNQNLLQIASNIELNDKKTKEVDVEPPQNDRDNIETQQVVLAIWDELFAQLAAVSPDLGRSLSYFSGAPFSFSPVVSQIQTMYLNRYATLKELRRQTPQTDTVDLPALVSESRQRYLSYKTQVISLRYERNVADARLFPVSVVSYDFRLSNRGWLSSSSNSENGLLTAINQELVRQFNEMQSAATVRSKPHTIELPSEMLPTHDTLGRWARLQDVSLSGVKLRDRRVLRSLKLEIVIFHPAFGNICNTSSCYFVDLRDESAEINKISFTTALDRDGRVVASPKLAGDYVSPPFSAPLTLEISLSRRKNLNGTLEPLTKAPQIKRLDLVTKAAELR